MSTCNIMLNELNCIENRILICSLADQMRLLNYAQWMKLLQNVFDSLLVLLKRVKVR